MTSLRDRRILRPLAIGTLLALAALMAAPALAQPVAGVAPVGAAPASR